MQSLDFSGPRYLKGLSMGRELPEGVPPTHRERVYTSPIEYTPKG